MADRPPALASGARWPWPRLGRAIDLAENIGTGRWYRGVVVMLCGIALAVGLWSGWPAIRGAPAMDLDAAAADQWRSQSVAPLRLGGDMGQRMGPGAQVAALPAPPPRPRANPDSILVPAPAPAPAPATPRRAAAGDMPPLRIRGVAGASLYRAARASGAPLFAIQQFLAAIDAHLSLDEVHPGDTFDMILARRRSAQGDMVVGDVLYAAIESGGRMKKQLLRWGGDGQFFDASTMTDTATGQAGAAGQIMPVAGARVTSAYGWRLHPILGYGRMHAGTDLAAPWGAPVYAVADGVVCFTGAHGGHGNYIRLDHGGGTGTGYGHLSRFAVHAGLRVRAGQVIGYVGSTGLSTGPHLHYEVFRGGVSIDPMSARFTVRAGVPLRERGAFRARLARVLAIRPGIPRDRI